MNGLLKLRIGNVRVSQELEELCKPLWVRRPASRHAGQAAGRTRPFERFPAHFRTAPAPRAPPPAHAWSTRAAGAWPEPLNEGEIVAHSADNSMPT